MNFAQWFRQLNLDGILEILVAALAGLISMTFHEVSHGYAAYMLGDPTAKRMGRLSLNPLRHVDPLGLLCIALVHFGWAKAVPINPRNFRHFRRGTAITALAGPAMNILLAILSLTFYAACLWLFYYLGGPAQIEWVLLFLDYSAIINIGLAVFNLFPIPPLDGSKILLSVMPQDAYGFVLRYERYGFILLMLLLYSGILSGPLGVLRDGLLSLLWPLCNWPISVLNNLFY